MENSLFPEHEWDYVDRAVERVKLAWMFHRHMNPDGKPMQMAFSGGKDSICLFFVCKKASEELGIPMEQMFHVQYNVTNVDPPPLVRFIRDTMKKEYPFIEMHHSKKTMWKLIAERKMPPTRIVRYCCSDLKEVSQIKGGYTLTGVRRAESIKRSARSSFEALGKTRKEAIFLDDNTENRRVDEYCMQRNAYTCNPIIDWSDEDVWKYIKGNNLPYCSLYDEGWKRIGCIGCPLAPIKEREKEFATFPKYAKCYKRAFQRMLDNREDKEQIEWKTGEEVFEWWMYGDHSRKAEQEEILF